MEYIILLIIYILVLLLVSVYANIINRHHDKDYLLGGRSLGIFSVGFSAATSSTGASTLLSTLGWMYINGVNVALGYFIACVIGLSINWGFMAKRIRQISVDVGASTLSELIVHNVIGKTLLLRSLSSIIIILFFIMNLVILLAFGGQLIHEEYPDISYKICVFIVLLIVALYVIIGGFLAVVWTDMVQAFFILFFIIAFPFIYVYVSHDSVSSIINKATLHQPNILNLNFEFFSVQNISFGIIVIIGYLGQPDLISRFMSISHINKLHFAAIVGSIWEIYIQIFAFIVAIFVAAYFTITIDNPEMGFMILANSLFESKYAIGIILAIIMSLLVTSANSKLIVVSSNITENFMRLTTKYSTALVFKVTTVIISLIAYFIAIGISGNLFKFSIYTWLGVSLVFVPLLIFVVRKNRISSLSAIISILVSVITILLWYLFNNQLIPIAGVIIAYISIHIVNSFTLPKVKLKYA